MKFLSEYYTPLPDGTLQFTQRQASRFAKQVADDYNPIHDVDAQRFCVPGDLLFAVVLARLGLRQQMSFHFAGMVVDGVILRMDDSEEGKLVIRDERGKEYLHTAFSGPRSTDEVLIEQLIRSYVRFSGHNFPHILQPLMAKHQVMINPARPLVIYESMSIHFDTMDLRAPSLELVRTEMDVDGKRGNAHLDFNFLENGRVVGTGVKRMVLSGLRAYEQASIDDMVFRYDERKRLNVE